MALPTSPPIDLKQIYREFGAPDGTNLTDLVRGGQWVPDTAANAGVPTTPPIGLLHFLGASRSTSNVYLGALNMNANSDDGLTPAVSSIVVKPNGYVHGVINGSELPASFQWLLEGVAAEHEFMFTHRVTPVSFVSAMAAGTWYPISSVRSVTVQGSIGLPNKPGKEGYADLDVRIRHLGLGKSYGPVRWVLSAEGVPG